MKIWRHGKSLTRKRIYDEQQAQPWAQMGRLAGIANPMATMGGVQAGSTIGTALQGGTTGASSTAGQAPLWQRVAGGALSGAGATGSPWGAVLGGVLGAAG